VCRNHRLTVMGVRRWLWLSQPDGARRDCAQARTGWIEIATREV